MADLLDIAPSTACEAVRINGGERLIVRGLHGNSVASIAARYPKVIALLFGGFGTAEFQQPQFLLQLGEAIAPIIAAACGNLGNEEAERRANDFLLEDQAKLLKAIWGLTFPNGLDAFVKVLTNLSGAAGEGEKPVRVRLRKSQSVLPPSSDGASRQTMQ